MPTAVRSLAASMTACQPTGTGRPTWRSPARPIRGSSSSSRCADAARVSRRRHAGRGARGDRAGAGSRGPAGTLYYCPALADPGIATARRPGRQHSARRSYRSARPVFEKISYREGPDGWLAVVPSVVSETGPPAARPAAARAGLRRAGEARQSRRDPAHRGRGRRRRGDRRRPGHRLGQSERGAGQQGDRVLRAGGVGRRARRCWTGSPSRGLQLVAATPDANQLVTGTDLTGPTAIAVGAEQTGLPADWLDRADVRVQDPDVRPGGLAERLDLGGDHHLRGGPPAAAGGRARRSPLGTHLVMPDLSLLPPSAVIDGADLRIGGCSLTERGRRIRHALVRHRRAGAARPGPILCRTAWRARHPRSRVCFATKSFPSASMISILAGEGLGFDVVGEGELRIALAGGADPGRDRHARQREVRRRTSRPRSMPGSATSSWTASTTSTGSTRLATRPTPVLLRVSPGIESKTHLALATGGKSAKFGVPVEQVPEALARMQAAPMIEMRGLHAHIGSQILNLEQFEAEVEALASLGAFESMTSAAASASGTRRRTSRRRSTSYLERLVAAAHRHLGARRRAADRARPVAGCAGRRHALPRAHAQAGRQAARGDGRRHGRQPGVLALRPAIRAAGRRPLGRAAGARRPRRTALRVGRHRDARTSSCGIRRSATSSSCR